MTYAWDHFLDWLWEQSWMMATYPTDEEIDRMALRGSPLAVHFVAGWLCWECS